MKTQDLRKLGAGQRFYFCRDRAWAQPALLSGFLVRRLARMIAALPLLPMVIAFATVPSGAEEGSAQLVQMGDEAFAAGRYSDAVEFYRSALRGDETYFTARLKLIELLARLDGREAEARSEMDAALGIESLSAAEIGLIAQICAANGFPDKAKSAYEALLKKNPGDLSAPAKLIEILLSEKDFGGAKARIEAYEAGSSATVEALEMIAARCIAKSQYDLARIAYEGALKRDEKNLGALLGIGECLVRLGQLSEGAERLSWAAERHPERAEPCIALGKLYLRTGEYGSAREAFGNALKLEPKGVEAAEGCARSLFLTGRYSEAGEVLREALKITPDSPVLLVSLGRLLAYIGDHESAREHFESALAVEPGYPDAILGLGMSYRERGQLDLAEKQFQRLYDFWDARVRELDSVRPGDLVDVAIACALTDNPQDAVDVLEQVLKTDPTNTEALLWEARLFSERHQPTDAQRELQKLLRINPNHPEAHAELASIYVESSRYDLAAESCQHALNTNPSLIRALDLFSAIQMLDFEYREAEETLRNALTVNPRSLSSLSSLASCYWQQGKTDEYEEVRKKVFEINPVYSEFYLTVARACENKRRNEEAIELLKQAIALKPDYAPAHTKIGILLMREGQEQEAETYLRKSYELDRYNPKTTNFINLLDHMRKNFVTTRTEHFLMRWNKAEDAVLGFFLPKHVEVMYREICEEFGYEPKNPTLVEIFDSHDQFSARIVGLPFIATVGASLGKVVAADSPRTGAFDWKDVLRHEFVHVLNLQQSKMQIPFWFTEGLATCHEESPLPAEWDGLLARMFYLGEIIPLEELNSCFTRPETPRHKQAAYAEANLICRYLYEEHGREVVRKMIEMYAENLPTEEVIRNCLSVNQEEFEGKISQYIFAQARQKRAAPLFLPGDGRLIEEIMDKTPDSSRLLVGYARWLLDEALRPGEVDYVKLDEAEELVAKVVEDDPGAPGAWATLAEIHLCRENHEEAKEAAQKAIALDEKDFVARRCLGFAYRQKDDVEKAIGELEKAIALSPRSSDVWIALASLYAEQKDEAGRIRSLEGLVRANPKDVRTSQTLVAVYLSRGHNHRAIEVLQRALRYNLYDANVYALLVDALQGQGSWKTARHYAGLGAEVAYIGAESLMPFQRKKVLELLNLALELDPDHKKARSLLGRIGN